MHPLILQQLATDRVNDMIATAADSRRAREGRRTRRAAHAEDSVMTDECSDLRPGRHRWHRYGPGGGVKMSWVPMRRQITCGCPDTRSAP